MLRRRRGKVLKVITGNSADVFKEAPNVSLQASVPKLQGKHYNFTKCRIQYQQYPRRNYRYGVCLGE
jgi:hypothetical protein